MSDPFYYTRAIARALRDHGLASRHSVADVLAMDELDALTLPGIGRKILTRARFEAPKIVVSQHPAFTDYLREVDLIGEEYIPTTASPRIEDVWGRHIITSDPISLGLARRAALVTEIPVHVPPLWKGEVLTLNKLRECAYPTARTYNAVCLQTNYIIRPKPHGAASAAQ